MKFEELENVWAAQPPPAANPATDFAASQRSLVSRLKQRSRMLGYGIFMATFGLVVFPALAFANYRYAGPQYPAWQWVNLAIWMIAYAAALILLLRKVRRHRARLRQSADTIRAITIRSLATCEAEMRDYRRGLWLLAPVLGLQLLNLYLKFPIPASGWAPFGFRAGTTLGFSLLLVAVFWRHYQVNLKPDHARQKEVLRDLG
jgi:MFS family permease